MSDDAKIDKPRIETAVREILLAIGEDPNRDGLRRTPHRVAEAYEELFAGLRENPRDHLRTTFDEDHKEMVVLRDIPFASLCEHHLLPFTGVAHIGYIPHGRIVGLSKLARLVEPLAAGKLLRWWRDAMAPGSRLRQIKHACSIETYK